MSDILIVERKDLTFVGRSKDRREIGIEHISDSIAVALAGRIVFEEDGFVKVLKNRMDENSSTSGVIIG